MPLSYVVKTESGKVYRRNRRHLRSSGIQNTGRDNILDSYEPSDISQKPSESGSIPSQQSQSAPLPTPVNTSPPRSDMGASSPKHNPKVNNTQEAVSSPKLPEDAKPYVTRSGRTVKPKQILNL